MLARAFPRPLCRAVLELRFRSGGEEIKPIGQAHTRKLKKLLQEEGVVPWMRDRLPLLYSGENLLVAVADLVDCVERSERKPELQFGGTNRPGICCIRLAGKLCAANSLRIIEIRVTVTQFLVTFKTVFIPTTARISKGWRKALNL